MGRQLGAPTQGFHGAPEPRHLCHTLSPWRRRLAVAVNISYLFPDCSFFRS